jgi:hypothetical protein
VQIFEALENTNMPGSCKIVKNRSPITVMNFHILNISSL